MAFNPSAALLFPASHESDEGVHLRAPSLDGAGGPPPAPHQNRASLFDTLGVRAERGRPGVDPLPPGAKRAPSAPLPAPVADASARATAAEAKASSLTTALESYQTHSAALQARVSQLEAAFAGEVSSLASELDAASARVTELEAALAAEADGRAAAESDARAWRGRVADLEQTVQQLAGALHTAQDEATQEREACFAALRDCEVSTVERDALSQRLDLVTAQARESGYERDRARSDADAAHASQRAAAAAAAAVTRRAEEGDVALSAARVELDRLRREVAEGTAARMTLQGQVVALQAGATSAWGAAVEAALPSTSPRPLLLPSTSFSEGGEGARDAAAEAQAEGADTTVLSLMTERGGEGRSSPPPPPSHHPSRRILYQVLDAPHAAATPATDAVRVEVPTDTPHPATLRVVDGEQSKTFHAHSVHPLGGGKGGADAPPLSTELRPLIQSVMSGRSALCVLACAPSLASSSLTTVATTLAAGLFSAMEGQEEADAHVIRLSLACSVLDVDAGGSCARDLLAAAVSGGASSLDSLPVLWEGGVAVGGSLQVELASLGEVHGLLGRVGEARGDVFGAGGTSPAVLAPRSHLILVLSVLRTPLLAVSPPTASRLYLLLPATPATVALASREGLQEDYAAAVQAQSSACSSALHTLQAVLDRLFSLPSVSPGGELKLRLDVEAHARSNALTAAVSPALQPSSSLLFLVRVCPELAYACDADVVSFLLFGDDLYQTAQLAAHRLGGPASAAPPLKPALKKPAVSALTLLSSSKVGAGGGQDGQAQRHDAAASPSPTVSTPSPDGWRARASHTVTASSGRPALYTPGTAGGGMRLSPGLRGGGHPGGRCALSGSQGATGAARRPASSPPLVDIDAYVEAVLARSSKKAVSAHQTPVQAPSSKRSDRAHSSSRTVHSRRSSLGSSSVRSSSTTRSEKGRFAADTAASRGRSRRYEGEETPRSQAPSGGASTRDVAAGAGGASQRAAARVEREGGGVLRVEDKEEWRVVAPQPQRTAGLRAEEPPARRAPPPASSRAVSVASRIPMPLHPASARGKRVGVALASTSTSVADGTTDEGAALSSMPLSRALTAALSRRAGAAARGDGPAASRSDVLIDLDALIADEVAETLRLQREMESFTGPALTASASSPLRSSPAKGALTASVLTSPGRAVRASPLFQGPAGVDMTALSTITPFYEDTSPYGALASPADAPRPPSLRMSPSTRAQVDPVPGMRSLLSMAQVGMHSTQLLPRHLDELRMKMAMEDTGGRGALNAEAFGRALVAWMDSPSTLPNATLLLAHMGLSGEGAIDYLDFVDGLESLAIGDGLLS